MCEKVAARKLPRAKAVVREDYLIDACRHRRALHVGCADAPFTRRKHEDGTLLHGKLAGVASELVGIDCDEDALVWLGEHGVHDLFLRDASEIGGLLRETGFRPEVIVAGEVLEHLLEPLQFLNGISSVMDRGTKLVLSVPNAFAATSVASVWLRKEKVHPEHVAYYSYFTIRELLRRTGFEVVDQHPYVHPPGNVREILFSGVVRFLSLGNPHFSDGYVLSAVRAARG